MSGSFSITSFAVCLQAWRIPICLPQRVTFPSWVKVMIGFRFARLPSVAAVFESLPPFARYSSVSSPAKRRSLGFRCSTSVTISCGEQPLSRILTARSTRILMPRVAILLSIMKMSSYSAMLFASTAFWKVPLRALETRTAITVSPASFAASKYSRKLAGEGWEVRGKSEPFVSSSKNCSFVISLPSRYSVSPNVTVMGIQAICRFSISCAE